MKSDGWLWVLAGAVTAGGLFVLLFLPKRENAPEVDALSTPPDPNRPSFPHVEIQPGFYLRADAGRAFLAMREAARAEGVDLPVSTAYRSLAWQQKLYAAWLAYKSGAGPWAPLAAKPDGNGPHQRGRAVDLHGFDSAKANYNAKRDAWMKRNSATYGWRQTGLTFSMREPWHFYFEGSAAYPVDSSLVA